jgi:hypothetical protein
MRIREVQKYTDMHPQHCTLQKLLSSKISSNFRGKKSEETVQRRMRTWRARPVGGWEGGAGPCLPVRGRPGTAPPSPPPGSRQTAAAAGGRALLSPCLKGQFHEMNIFYEVSSKFLISTFCVCALMVYKNFLKELSG